MNEIENIYSVLTEINKIGNNANLVNQVQILTRLRTTFQQTPQTIVNTQVQQNQVVVLPKVIDAMDKIIEIVSTIDLSMWNSEHEYISEKLGIFHLIGENGRKHFEDLKLQMQNNMTLLPNLIQSTITELNSLKTKPTQFLNLLNTFDLKSNIKLLEEDEGIIEITFDGGVAIEDFKEAKDQMNDWFLIIEGYVRLLGVTREDFEIINISKNSPTKFKIKTTLKNTALVLTIITSVLLIEKTVLENKLMIEQLKHNNLVPDVEVQKAFIESAEKNIDAKIEVGIDKIVKQKLLEYNIGENSGDVEINLKKGIQNQYNFVVNGGTVNVYTIDGKLKNEIITLENTKEDIRLIKDAYENQKTLTSGKKTNKNTDENAQQEIQE